MHAQLNNDFQYLANLPCRAASGQVEAVKGVEMDHGSENENSVRIPEFRVKNSGDTILNS